MTDAPENQPDPASSSEATQPASSSTPATPTQAQRETVRESTEPVDQSELDLGVISTGSTLVDHTLQPLEGLADRPVTEHAEVFEAVLTDLSGTMTDGTTGDPSVGPSGASDHIASGGPGETAHAR